MFDPNHLIIVEPWFQQRLDDRELHSKRPLFLPDELTLQQSLDRRVQNLRQILHIYHQKRRYLILLFLIPEQLGVPMYVNTVYLVLKSYHKFLYASALNEQGLTQKYKSYALNIYPLFNFQLFAFCINFCLNIFCFSILFFFLFFHKRVKISDKIQNML